jgi:hypothetical protein
MRRRWLVIGVTLLLTMAASAATVAHHSPGHNGGPDRGSDSDSSDGVALDPGESVEVDCETELTVDHADGAWLLHCAEHVEEEPEPTQPPEEPSDDGSDDEHHDDEAGGSEPDPGESEYVGDVDEWLYGSHHWSVEPLSVVNPDELEEPVEGQACPDWVNFTHTTQAADGDYYLTWRPIVDPNYGCHFTHEHGSNPAHVEGAEMPAFGYGTEHHMRESNYGFKVKALHAADGTEVLATTHFGTAEPHLAACQRYHWNNFQFVQDGEVVADITFMGDFGSARNNETDEPLDHDCVDPRTGEVVSQADIMEESYGVRLNPVCEGDDCGPFYYPWRMDTRGLGSSLGFTSGAYTVNTPTVMAACEDMTCQESRHIGGHGAWAFVAFNTGFGVTDSGNNGEFYTDPYGLELRDPSDPDAVRQYIKPGVDISLDGGSDQASYFPDARFGGTHGDYVYTLMENGDPNIMGNVRNEVDPQGYIQGKN